MRQRALSFNLGAAQKDVEQTGDAATHRSNRCLMTSGACAPLLQESATNVAHRQAGRMGTGAHAFAGSIAIVYVGCISMSIVSLIVSRV